MVHSTYLGARSDESGYGIRVGPSGEAYVTGFTFSINFPATPGAVRVSNGGAARTTNSGASWAAINGGLTSPTVLSMAIDYLSQNNVYAGTQSGGIFKSGNGGGSWSPINSGLTDLNVRAVKVDPTSSSIVYLGTSSRGIFRSTDSGNTWRAINTGQNGMTVNALELDPANSSILYAATNAGVSKSTNGGASWANTGLVQSSINSLAIDPVNTSTLYASPSYSGLYKSTNGGANWTLTSLSDVYVSALAIDPLTPTTIYAGTINGMLKSTDGGATWNSISVGLSNKKINALILTPGETAGSAYVVYAGTDNGVFMSNDGGSNWSSASMGIAGAVVNTLASIPINRVTIYAGTAAGNNDAFVTRLNAAGSGLIYSTFLGGSGADVGSAIAIDAAGNAYVTGNTSSKNFPTTPGLFQNTDESYSTDAFVTKLDPSATLLAYSTYLGSYDTDRGTGIAIDSSGNAYVTGTTQSQAFPVTSGAFQTVPGGGPGSYGTEGFISKIISNPALSADLRITMTASQSSVNAGSSIRYDIVLTNDGPERAPSVEVTDVLPSSLIYSSCSSSYNYCYRLGNTITFRINSLEPGATTSMTIYANVSCSINDGAVINNTVMVSSSALDPNTSNNSATATASASNPPAVLSPQFADFSAGGGTGQVSVYNNNSSCAWTSMSNASWITINYSTNCCNGYVNYQVAANNGAPRTGSLTIAGQTLTVNQEGVCSVSISPTAASYGAIGGIGALNVTAASGCVWTVFTSVNWITINSASEGSGNGTVAYSVAANDTSSSRTGLIRIGGETFTINQSQSSLAAKAMYDFDGDQRADVAVWRPSAGVWFIINSLDSSMRFLGWGTNGDMIAPGDYDGDGKADIAIYRPSSNATWYIINSSDSSINVFTRFSVPGVAVPGDYDGDGKTDKAQWNPSTGQWTAFSSSGGSDLVSNWGASGDIPVQGDYDGDGQTDLAVWRPSNGTWYIFKTTTRSARIVTWGVNGDVPVAGDYDGDGQTDIAVWRPFNGTWYIINSSNNSVSLVTWGVVNDRPVPADFDGDGKADIAIWRPSNGAWYIRNSSNNSITITGWGVSGDVPVPSVFIAP